MQTDNNCIVIFGASGDLTHRKLIPALYNLYKIGRLSENFSVLGVARSDLNDETFRKKMREALIHNEETTPETLDAFCSHLYYQAVNTSDAQDYGKLVPRLDDLHDKYQTCGNTFYYMSTPPNLYGVIPECLAAHGLNTEEYGWKRIIVEKPFGYDEKTAQTLDVQIHRFFEEHQIYRIDHYLGKETVQNLLVLRFSNGWFEPLWNRNFIDYVEITGAESIGVEERGGYYDGSGAMRDMFQNHLLQVLAMVAMEPPAIINANSMRDEVAKVMHSLRPLTSEDMENNLVLGQYTAAEINGKMEKGYLEEKGVPANSRTETYIALRCEIENWRWAGVPFYVRTGKRLPARVTEIVIHFKTTPHPVFSQNAPENKLIIRIQPDEAISMRFGLKKPGAGFEAKEVSMDFRYADLAGAQVLTAYERLLLDAMKGDATLFARTDAVHAAWKFVQPILDYKANGGRIHEYEAGTWGPVAADKLIAKQGKVWRKPTGLMKKKV
ncbi:glucose-6-phosphate dehydrogenase [Haemophilus influenzae biotype aegyptius]|uniref:glucose-6-phosphate dehydrogenase n=1 Tax=Haemophilus influenzae TaxID=727 RepID=UPI0001F3618A|nr:glucose-6-phosphate dehydrogenase [Haemophilus influenzae]QEQ62280.1 glucose-6-phosphate dehydrogenase [Haemophilus influenzae biotype aegyptius]QEQ64006.1 glucose-6-phosphate dehydrogenase [Haemophilus influenzae biotype aegyptius]QEQ65843.1 glucose-6-phosphate dehydrogenase [Haemophilus influenzae biotype aegyptius]TMQ36990.1 glucose-6-phosphate dehydrogenase [Haemophilus influenzae biotype aegyptius]TMQ37428.1 glucose-6-phosphate dehydrogenase [Haemophilus influenzae biotype aegyptius]